MKWFLMLVLLLSGFSQAQETRAKRLIGSVKVQGFVGGESHDAYVIRVEKGQILKVQVTAAQNQASLTVAQTAVFESAEPVRFGVSSSQRFVGKVLQSGDYYLYVVAYPSADYQLWLKLQ
jgi:hypothetical protein